MKPNFCSFSRSMKICCFFTFALFLFLTNFYEANNAYGYNVEAFNDVPEGHWAYESVMILRELQITDGVGDNNFGVDRLITAPQFEAFLGRMTEFAGSGEYDDLPVTRGEMTEMIIKSLGYERIAYGLYNAKTPFSDTGGYNGFAAMAYDFGLITSGADGLFRPYDTATRGEAAVILAKLYRVMTNDIKFINGFYAIKSAGQMELIDDLDCVSFGWSRLELDKLNMTTENSNEYSVPEGYRNTFSKAKANGKKAMLMIAVQNIMLQSGIQLSEHILSDEQRSIYIEMILEAIYNNAYSLDFDGVVIDIEGLKGEELKLKLNSFLAELKDSLVDKEMFVAVHPVRKPGEVYFDAYDFKFIGDIADKVILMAHDYNAKRISEADMQSGYTITPLTPIDEIYYALRAITDKDTGISDKSKIALQISFDTAQWKLKDGKIVNAAPYHPDYETLIQRIEKGVSMNYSSINEAPYIEFVNYDDATENIIWYEDSRSVSAKIRLAKLFGIDSLSVWRLGNVPNHEDSRFYLNVWEECFAP